MKASASDADLRVRTAVIERIAESRRGAEINTLMQELLSVEKEEILQRSGTLV